MKPEEMQIEKYTSYFHDGTVHAIYHKEKRIVFSMESSQLESDWNKDNIQLSKNSTISGKLYADQVIDIQIDGKKFHNLLKKTSGSSDIYDLCIQKNKILLLIGWINYPPKPPLDNQVFTIEIEAEHIFWENIPHLFEDTW